MHVESINSTEKFSQVQLIAEHWQEENGHPKIEGDSQFWTQDDDEETEDLNPDRKVSGYGKPADSVGDNFFGSHSLSKSELRPAD